MSSSRVKLAILVAVIAAAVVTSAALAGRGASIKATLSGYEEAPLTLSSPASGKFRAKVDDGGQKIVFKLRYGGFETDVTQAHIHFGARATDRRHQRLAVRQQPADHRRTRRYAGLPGARRHGERNDHAGERRRTCQSGHRRR